ncbi:MAG: oligosaccharide flippase family protein [Cellvibrionaceae bacterium]
MNQPAENLIAPNKTTSVLGGIFWLTSANLIAKIGGVFVQFLLAWLLDARDFGVYAIAMSTSALLLGLRNGGTDQLLILKQKQFDRLSPIILTYSGFFNLAAATIICLLAFPAAKYYQEQELIKLMPLIALSVITSIYVPVLSAQLSIQEQYQSLSKYTSVSILIKHTLTVVFALIGFGVYSFILPLLIQPLIFCYFSRHTINAFPKPQRINLQQTKSIFQDSKWLIFSNLSNQLTLHGQIFIFALFVTPEIVGFYFFTLIIINSPIMLINATFTGVIFPDLTKLADNREKLALRFNSFLNLFFSISSVIAIAIFITGPWVIDTFWQGKWNQSIPLLSALVFIIPFWVAIDLCAQYISSLGMWKERFFILFGTAVVDILAIFVVCTLFDFLSAIYILVLFKLIYFEVIIRIISHSKVKSERYHSFPIVIFFILILYNHFFKNDQIPQYLEIISLLIFSYYGIIIYKTINQINLIRSGS